MNVILPLLIMVMLVSLHLLNFKRLCRYIERTYPEKWQEINKDTMGLSSSTNPKLQFELKDGYFASLNDPQINKYKVIQRFILGVLFIVIFANIGYSIWT